MNKKFLTPVIIVLVLVGGIVFRQLSNKNHPPINEAAVRGLSDGRDTQEVEKNLVEVFYLPHPPVDPIRRKIKGILQKFPEYKLKEYDFYDDGNRQKIEDYNLVGHIPVAIFINGEDTFFIGGQEITFKNFPKGDAFVPTLEGSWGYDDLEKVLADPDRYKN